MPRYHATLNGNIPFTPEEELEADLLEQEYLQGAWERKKQELASFRYEKEIAGVTTGWSTIRTDRESQSLITGAWCTCQLNPLAVIDFKGENGWIQLSKTEVEAIASAVSSHVQYCFSREKKIGSLIDSLQTPEEVDQMDIPSLWQGE